MNKRLTSLILAVVMLLSLTVTAVPTFATGTDNGLSLSKEKASAGETFELYLKIPPITAGKSAANEFKIDYDKAVVKLTEFNPGCPSGASIGAYSTPDEANAAGQVGVNYNTAGGGNLADWSEGLTYTFKFQVLDSAAVGNTKFEITTYTIVGYEEDGFTEIDYTPAGVVKEAILNITAAPKPATGISLNKSTLKLTVGESETLVATVEPADTTDTVTWDTGRSDVATVDSTGKVTAVAPGTANITAKAGSQSASCVVTVENAPCTHTNKTPVSAKSSTCKVQGWDAYSKCNDCGQLFDKDGNAISAIPYLPLADHTPVQTATAEYLNSAATCTSPAVYYEHCSVCDVKLNTTFTSGSTVPHTESGWKSDADGHWKVCTVCGTTTTAKVAHTPDHTGHATEEYAIKCTECGYEIEAQLSHTHSLTPVAAKSATCTEDGNKAYYVCSGCSKWFEDATGSVEITDHSSVILTANGHTPSDWKFDADNHWKECTVDGCGVIIEDSKAAHTESDWIIDTEATATTDGTKHKECTECGYVMETGTIPATGSGEHTHSYGSDWKSNADKHWHECSCGAKAEEAAHTASDWIIDTAATATTDGTKHKECTVCHRVLETCKIPATGSGEHTHSYSSDWKSDSINHWHECSCGVKDDVAAHTFKWVIDKEATATKKGSKHEECKFCGYQRPAVEIPATGSTTKPTDPTESNPNTGALDDVPQTGDNSNMILWIVLLLASGLGVTGTVVYSKRKKYAK